MHFTAILSLSLALCGPALIAAAPLQQRSAATVLSDISSISAAVSTLTGEVSSYNGTALQNEAIISSANDLNSTLQTAASDATASAAFDEADSESVASAISSVTSDFITLLSHLDAVSSIVVSQGNEANVEEALVDFLSEVDALLSAVTDKVTESEEAAIGTSADELNAAFKHAIAVFSS